MPTTQTTAVQEVVQRFFNRGLHPQYAQIINTPELRSVSGIVIREALSQMVLEGKATGGTDANETYRPEQVR